MLSDTNSRLASARRLTTRKGRRETGLFLAEGTQAVREALAGEAVVELFATPNAAARHTDLLVDRVFDEISDKAARSLTETITPQGIVAVCRQVDVGIAEALAGSPRLVAVLVDCNEPGNAGAVLRVADAAGADAVVMTGGVDLYNGKTVRASAGSVFHLPITVSAGLDEVLATARAAGLRSVATALSGHRDIDALDLDGSLELPTLWLFGSEAHGLSAEVVDHADETVRIPIHGRAESLNLATAAAVCLYASARAQRRPSRQPARVAE